MTVELVVLTESGNRKIFTLPSNVTVLGRRRDCDFRIPLGIISKRHCKLTLDGDVLTIRDLGSRNGTIVNGEKVTERVLKAGDKVMLGPVTIVLRIDGQPEEIIEEEIWAKKAGKKAAAKKEELANLHGDASTIADISSGSLDQPEPAKSGKDKNNAQQKKGAAASKKEIEPSDIDLNAILDDLDIDEEKL